MKTQSTKKPAATAQPVKAGVFRYIAAIFYDLMLVIAAFFVATAALLPFTAGEAIESSVMYPLYLLGVSFAFYGWFWTHGGQTLGLRAWKLRVVTEQQTDISWQQALIRFLTACVSWLALGLGIFWCIWQKDNKTWQDLSSRSMIVRIDAEDKAKT